MFIILLYILSPATSADRFYRIDKAQVGYDMTRVIIHRKNKKHDVGKMQQLFNCDLFMCACRSIFTS